MRSIDIIFWSLVVNKRYCIIYWYIRVEVVNCLGFFIFRDKIKWDVFKVLIKEDDS